MNKLKEIQDMIKTQYSGIGVSPAKKNPEVTKIMDNIKPENIKPVENNAR